MAIEIKLNGKKVDIDDKPIGVTFQAIDIGDLKKLKADLSSSIQLMNTAKNHKIMNYTGILGSANEDQLGQIDAEFISNGVTLMPNARARIQGTKKGGYDINILGGNFAFFDRIKDKSLRDFDWSAYNVATDTSGSYFRDLYEANSGVCFPIAEYRKDPYYKDGMCFEFAITVTDLIPWMFVHTVIEEIFTQSGFTFTGEMFNEERYKKMILATTPVSSIYPSDTPGTIVIGSMMPDITAVDFIKGILFQFAAFITTIESKIYVIQFKKHYQNVGDNWSKKLDETEEPSILFEIGYAQNNHYKYSEIDNPYLDYTGVREYPGTVNIPLTPEDTDGTLVADNGNLAFEKTIVDLPFQGVASIEKYVNEDVTKFGGTIVNRVTIPWLLGTDVDAGSIPAYDVDWNVKIMILADVSVRSVSGSFVGFNFYRPDKSGLNFIFNSIKFRTGYFDEFRFNSDSFPVTSEDLKLTWDALHSDYWNEIENSLLKNPTKVIAKFNLTEVDIYNLKELMPDGKIGREVPIYVRQLNGHYFINKINKFISGRMTEVELIRL